MKNFHRHGITYFAEKNSPKIVTIVAGENGRVVTVTALRTNPTNRARLTGMLAQIFHKLYSSNQDKGHPGWYPAAGTTHHTI